MTPTSLVRSMINANGHFEACSFLSFRIEKFTLVGLECQIYKKSFSCKKVSSPKFNASLINFKDGARIFVSCMFPVWVLKIIRKFTLAQFSFSFSIETSQRWLIVKLQLFLRELNGPLVKNDYKINSEPLIDLIELFDFVFMTKQNH